MFSDGRGLKVAVAGGVLAGALLMPVARASETGCGGPQGVQPTRTFDVEARVAEDEYRLGDTARFRVKVTRATHGQVVGPAEGANLVVSVVLGDVVLAGGAVTNDRGTATVGVRLKRYAAAGRANVAVYADKEIADLPCRSELEREFGSVKKRGLFRVVS